MGYQAVDNGTPLPTKESFHLGIARCAYLNGTLDADEYERSVAHVLSGGTLDQRGRVRESHWLYTSQPR